MNKKIELEALQRYLLKLNLGIKSIEKVNSENASTYAALVRIIKSSYYINAGEEVSLIDNLSFIDHDRIANTVSMREYIQAVGSGVWEDGFEMPFLTSTQEHVGHDRKGIYAQNKKTIVLILHNTTLIEYKNMYKYKTGGDYIEYHASLFEEYIAKYSQKNSPIPLYEYTNEEYEKLELGKPYGIIMPYEIASKSRKGLLSIDGCLENELLIARAGGKKYLREFLQSLIKCKKEYLLKKNLIRFNHKHSQEPSVPLNRGQGYFIIPFSNPSPYFDQGILPEGAINSTGVMLVYENEKENE